MQNPLISVIIPHLNQAEQLETCLNSLRAQTLPREAYEIVVADNGSVLLPNMCFDRDTDINLVYELEPGPGLARNRGVGAARANILAFIDADCVAHPDWLSRALTVLGASPSKTILSGDVKIWQADKSMSALEAYESIFAYRFELYVERHGYSGTGNLIVRRSDFEMIGGFAGISIAEDMEWGRRARAKGRIFCYAPDVIVFHPARKTLRELLVKYDRDICHDINAADKKSFVWRAKWYATALALLVSPLVDWSKIIVSDRVSGIVPRLKAIGVLAVVRSYRSWKMLTARFENSEPVWNRSRG